MNIVLSLCKHMKILTKKILKDSGLESYIPLSGALLYIFLGPWGRHASHSCKRLIGFSPGASGGIVETVYGSPGGAKHLVPC